MLNTLTKPRFQTFVKIFQGPMDRPTRLVLEAPPRSLKIKKLRQSCDSFCVHIL